MENNIKCSFSMNMKIYCTAAKYHSSIYRAQTGIYLKHEHTVPREIQKSTFKSKYILNIQKDKRNEETVRSASISFCCLFVVFNSALDHHTQQIFTHYFEMDNTSLVCTLVVEGRVSGFVGWHHMSRHWGFHLQRQLCVFYTFCYGILTSGPIHCLLKYRAYKKYLN